MGTIEEVFNEVIGFIDEHIKYNSKIINEKLDEKLKGKLKRFKKLFRELVGTTLEDYMTARRAYLAAKELQEDGGKRTIAEIAYNYGYCDQSALTNAMRLYYNKTPRQLKNEFFFIRDNRLYFSKLISRNKKEYFVQRVCRMNDQGDVLPSAEMSIMLEMEMLSEELQMDFEAICTIGVLAEQMDIPMDVLARGIYNLNQEYKKLFVAGWEDDLLTQIHGDWSWEECNEVCEYYKCELYELNYGMVENYRQRVGKEKEDVRQGETL